MMRTVSLFLFFLLLLFRPALSMARDYHSVTLRPGVEIPAVPLLDTLTKKERQYLGLSNGLFNFRRNKTFFLHEIRADYIIVEFLNRYCVSCLAQAPVLNDLYYKILSDDLLRDRVKIIAVGVGNNQREVQRFRDEKKVLFPIIPDPEFKAYDIFGNPGGTPYFLILRQSPEGLLLVESHLGFVKTGDTMFSKLKELMPLDLASFQKKIHREKLFFEPKQPDIFWSEEEIRGKIKQLILAGGEEGQLSLQKKEGPGYKNLYIVDSLFPGYERRWFAKLYTRLPLCDLCHPISFLLIFDKEGVVTNFFPLHVTKYGNVLLSPADTQKLKGKIVGRHLDQRRQFEPECDSITGATMSASIIFDTLNKAGELYRRLQEAGYASGF